MVAQRSCQRQASVPSVLCSEVLQWVAWEVGLRREGEKQLTRGSSTHISKVCAVMTAQDTNGDGSSSEGDDARNSIELQYQPRGCR